MFKNCSSIPFIGSKWKYRNKLYEILKNNNFDFNKEYLIYDIFGGSGALSLIFKCMCPNSKIVFNDYDEIITDKQGNNKIDISINKSNKIINEIKNNIDSNKQNNKAKIIESLKVREVLNKYSNDIKNDSMIKKFIESQICFNGRPFKDNQNEYWYKFRKTDIPLYFKNFDGITIIHKDYEEVLKDITQLENQNNIIILLDPPYLNTTCKDCYKLEYWKLNKYLKMLSVISLNSNYKYLFFEGCESNLTDILNFMSDLTRNQKLKNIKHYELSKKEYVKLIY